MEKALEMSADQLIAAIEKVRTAREAVRALGVNCASKAAQFAAARSALALAESELREQGKRLGICVTVIEKEPERDQVVFARTLAGYQTSEE
jgi:hypothetical protein